MMFDQWPEEINAKISGDADRGQFGDPVPWMRPANRKGGGRRTPEKLRSWLKKCRMELAPMAPSEPFTGPIKLRLDFLVAVPQSEPKWRQTFLVGKPRIKYPDVSNYAKAIEDALDEAGFYEDDGQVHSLTANKRYCWPDDCGVAITLTAFPPYPERKTDVRGSGYSYEDAAYTHGTEPTDHE